MRRFTHGHWSEPLGTHCVSMRWACGTVVPCRLGRHGWDASAMPSVGSEWGSCTVGTLRRHHNLWVGLHFAHGCRSVPLGTLCDAMRWVCRLFVVKVGLSCRLLGRIGDTRWVCGAAVPCRVGCYGWDASAIPSVWVGVYPVVGLDASRW